MFTKEELKSLQEFKKRADEESRNVDSLGWKILYSQLKKAIDDIVRHSDNNSAPPPEPKRKKLMQ